MLRSRNTSDWNRPNLVRPSAGSAAIAADYSDDWTCGPCAGQFWGGHRLSGPSIADDTAIRFEFQGPTRVLPAGVLDHSELGWPKISALGYGPERGPGEGTSAAKDT